VSCRLEGHSSADTFDLSELVPGQYKLTTTRRLDFEVETSTSVAVVCSDAGQAPLTTRVNITVNVVDVNDNVPRFQQSRYQLNVPENKPPDFVVEQVCSSFRAYSAGALRVHNVSPFVSSSGLSPGSHEVKVQRAKVCLNCTEPSVARSSCWSLPVGRYLSDTRCKGSMVVLDGGPREQYGRRAADVY